MIRTGRALIVSLSGWVLLSFSAKALTLNITYDTSVTSSTNSAQIQSAFGTAVQTLQTLYTNPITINITVYWGASGPFSGGIGLGASSSQIIGNYTYAQLTNALRSSRTTVNDSNSVASLPPSDPIAGNVWWSPRAEAKALGLPFVTANDAVHDGDIGFADTVSYTFDPTNRAVSGKFDFMAVALHELTEVMGRITFDLSTTFLPYDLFRFTNSGARSFNVNATNAYFSVDNGATSMRAFYTNFSLGDIQDWLTTPGTSDACDAFISSGKKGILSYADLTAMDVMGYKLNYHVPKLAATRSGTNFVFSFTNISGTTYTVLTSTNLSLAVTNWTSFGTCTDSIPGQFQFTVPTTNTFRAFRVKLN